MASMEVWEGHLVDLGVGLLLVLVQGYLEFIFDFAHMVNDIITRLVH